MSISRISLLELCAGDLGLGVAGLNIDAVVSSTSYTINSLADYIPEDKAAQDAYAYFKALATPVWRRIDTYGYPTNNNVIVSRAVTGVNANTAVDIFFMLNPDEMIGAINAALNELFREDRGYVTLVDGNTKYDLTATLTWLTNKGQIQRTTFLWADPANAVNVIESAIPARRLVEESGKVYIIIPQLPPDCTNTKLAVTARKYYASLDTDAGTTDCPPPLARAAGKMRILQELWHKIGSTRAKANFGLEMAVTEKQFAALRTVYNQDTITHDPVMEEAWVGPEVPVEQGEWPW